MFFSNVFGECINGKKLKTVNENHIHPFYEIYYFCGDNMSYFLEDTVLNLTKYDMILVNKNTYHKTLYNKKGNITRYNICFDDTIFKYFLDFGLEEEFNSLFETPYFPTSSSFKKLDLIGKAQKIAEYSNSNNELLQKKSVVVMIDMIFCLMEEKSKMMEKNAVRVNSAREKKITEILSFINNNYYENINLQTISKDFFLSKFYLSREFKEITGMSIVDYINHKRISEAILHIKNGETPSNVYSKVGYNSHGYFIKEFKKRCGTTPGKYNKSI